MFLLSITLAIKVYVPFWNLLYHSRCVTHFSSAGAQVKHCTLTTFQQLHLTTEVWKKCFTCRNQCPSPCLVPMPQVNFFTGIHLPMNMSRAFCHTFHIWPYTLPSFKLKVYLCPLWSWDKLILVKLKHAATFPEINGLSCQKNVTITWKVGNSFVVLLILRLKSSHTTWNKFVLEQSNPETKLFVFWEFPLVYFFGKKGENPIYL